MTSSPRIGYSNSTYKRYFRSTSFCCSHTTSLYDAQSYKSVKGIFQLVKIYV